MSSPDEPATRIVLLNKDDIEHATLLWEIFKNDIASLEKMMDLREGFFHKLVRGISCACGAACDQPCITATGKRASRPHKSRHVAVLAAVFSMQREIVIQEEEQIEDVL